MRRAIFILIGVALGVGVAHTQTDPWWDPRNPSGSSAGVTYGSVLPTLANTGANIPDGLLAVQITGGAAPTLNMYDQNALAWFTFLAAGAAGLTDDTVPVWDAATNAFIDSGITDDALAIVITAQTTIDATTPGDITLTTTDTGNIVMAPATGQVLFPNGAAATPSGAFVNDIDTGRYLIGAGNMGFSVGGALVMDLEDTNAAGAGADLVTISSTLGIMDDNTDIFRGLFVDLTNANHTAAATSPLVYGIDIDTIVGDAQADEYAIHLNTGWDSMVWATGGPLDLGSGSARIDLQDTTFVTVFAFDTLPNPGATHTWMELADIAGVMNGSDTARGLFVDLTNADHTGTGNDLHAISIDSITEDPDAYETGIYLGGGWDTHITFAETGQQPAAAEDYPATGEVAIYLDDNVDYSGAGGVDCAFIAIDSTGNVTVLHTVVLNGPCP